MIKEFGKLTGPEKAAIMMFAVGEDYAAKTFSMLDEDEIRDLSQVMSNLGKVEARVVERLFVEFANQMSSGGAVVGTIAATQKLLSKVLDPERVDAILQDISGPSGRTVWEKLGNISDTVLANYLKNEYPQTVAVCLSKIKPEQAARVIALLPEALSRDVVIRMLKMETISREVMDDVEMTLRTEFMATLGRTQKRDPHENMAEIFNNMDRPNLNRLMEIIEQRVPDSAEKVKSLMFTFEDLKKLTAADIQAVLREVDKDALAVALKGASQEQRQQFFSAMSERAVKLLQEEIDSMGPVRVKDVYEAQGRIVTTTKELINRGVIEIPEEGEGNEMVE
ncbi:MAG: flagellar motor switch protein FliG [Alphaproteobacteria bacterium]|nr:flagellar motor switch protein FliG [Alphaproteobacteria bacterium]